MFDHVLLNTFLLNPVGTLARIGRVIPRTINTVFRSNAFFAHMSLFATTAQTSERSLGNRSHMTISLASEAAERIRDERPHCARQVANPDPFRQRWGRERQNNSGRRAVLYIDVTHSLNTLGRRLVKNLLIGHVNEIKITDHTN